MARAAECPAFGRGARLVGSGRGLVLRAVLYRVRRHPVGHGRGTGGGIRGWTV